MKKTKFIEVVPYFAGSYNLRKKADYMAIAPAEMAERGYECEYIVLKPKDFSLEEDKIRASIPESVKFKIFDSFWKYFFYMRKQKDAIIFAHARIFSSFICFLFGKRQIFMSHQSTLPKKFLARRVFQFFIN